MFLLYHIRRAIADTKIGAKYRLSESFKKQRHLSISFAFLITVVARTHLIGNVPYHRDLQTHLLLLHFVTLNLVLNSIQYRFRVIYAIVLDAETSSA